MVNDVYHIRVNERDFKHAAYLMGQMEFSNADSFSLSILTNRYQRRELTRHGISSTLN